jgi:hypothetical protein
MRLLSGIALDVAGSANPAASLCDMVEVSHAVL